MSALSLRIAEALRRGGARLAVIGDHVELSYDEVASTAETIAEFIKRQPLPVVAIVDRSDIATRLIYLGAILSGAPVVPVSPDWPPHRMDSVLSQAGVSLILDGEHILDEVVRLTDVGFEVSASAVRRDGEAAARAAKLRDGGIAYVLFTSGSTGTPKGVPIAGVSVSAFLDAIHSRFDFHSDDRFSSNFRLVFDVSVFDALIPLMLNASSVIPSTPTSSLDISRQVNQYQISIWFSVPSYIEIAHQLRALECNSLPSLRQSLFIGEPMSYAQAMLWFDAAPNTRLHNVYGPTETTVACSSYELERSALPNIPRQSSLPIGIPFDGVDFTIGSDRDANELMIAGAQVFTGYLGDLRGDTVFEVGHDSQRWYRSGDQVRADGDEWRFFGRLDRQVKLNGNRIELGEIEDAYRRAGCTWAHAVVEDEGNSGRLVVFMFAVAPSDDVRRRAHSFLPGYMHASVVVHVSNPPRTLSGKIDTSRLRRTHRRQ